MKQIPLIGKPLDSQSDEEFYDYAKKLNRPYKPIVIKPKRMKSGKDTSANASEGRTETNDGDVEAT